MVRRGPLVGVMTTLVLTAACSGTTTTPPGPTEAPPGPTALTTTTVRPATATGGIEVLPADVLERTTDARVLAASLTDGTVRLRVLLPPAGCYRNVGQPAFRRHVGVWYVRVVTGMTSEQAATSAFTDCAGFPAEQVVVTVDAPADMTAGDPIASWQATADGAAWQAVVAPLSSAAASDDVDRDRPVATRPVMPALVPTGMPDVPGRAPTWPVPPPVASRDPAEPWVAYLVDAAAGPGHRAVRVTLADAAPDDVDPSPLTAGRAVRHRALTGGALAVAEGHGVDGALLDSILAGVAPSTDPATLTLGPVPDGLTVLAAGRPLEPEVVANPSFGRYYPGLDLLLTHEPAVPATLAELATRPGVSVGAATAGTAAALRVDDGGSDGTSALTWLAAPGVLTTVRGPAASTDAIDDIARTLHVPDAANTAYLTDGWGRLGTVRPDGCASDLTVYGGWGAPAPGSGDDMRLLLVNDGDRACSMASALALTPVTGERVVVDVTDETIDIGAHARVGLSLAWSRFGDTCPAVEVHLTFAGVSAGTGLDPVRLAVCDGATASATTFAV